MPSKPHHHLGASSHHLFRIILVSFLGGVGEEHAPECLAAGDPSLDLQDDATAEFGGDIVGLLGRGDGLSLGDMDPPLLEQCLALVFMQSGHVSFS